MSQALTQPGRGETDWTPYWRWNEALVDYFFGEENEPRAVYLDVDGDSLAEIGASIGIDVDAIERFEDAVRVTCEVASQQYFVAHGKKAREWIFGEGDTEYPPSVAVLAFFSLAANRMAADGHFRQTNYYARLGELLCVPDGDRNTFQNAFRRQSLILWDSLNQWLLRQQGRRGLPTAYARGHLTFVGVPISQALLRQADRDELYKCFDDLRLPPGRVLAHADMGRLLRHWSVETNGASNLHFRIRSRETFEYVADVACQLLEAWSGTVPGREHVDRCGARLLVGAELSTLFGKRITFHTLVRGILQVPDLQYRWTLSQGEGAEATIDVEFDVHEVIGSGFSRLQARGALPLRALLESNVEMQSGDTSPLTREPRRLVVFERNDALGAWLETDRATLGQPLLLLVHQSLQGQVVAVLDGKSRAPLDVLDADQLAGLPAGWVCFPTIELGAVPSIDEHLKDLAALEPFERSSILVSRGLLLPERNTWLSDCPPDISVTTEEPENIRVLLRVGHDEEVLLATGRRNVDAQLRETPVLGRIGAFRVVVTTTDARTRVVATKFIQLVTPDSPRLLRDETPVLSHCVGDPAWAITAAPIVESRVNHGIRGMHSDLKVGSHGFCEVAGEGTGLDWHATQIPIGTDLDMQFWSDDVPPRIAEGEHAGFATPACFAGAAHHWVLPDAGQAQMMGPRPYKLQEKCRHCGLEHWRATRHTRANEQVVVPNGIQMPVVERPTELPSRVVEDAEITGDALLNALTYLRRGTWRDFELLAGQVETEAWYAIELGRDLSALGHIDIQLDLKTMRPVMWSLAPTVISEAGPMRWIISGARAPRVLALLRDRTVEFGGEYLTNIAVPAGIWERSNTLSLIGLKRLEILGLDQEVMELIADDVGDETGEPLCVTSNSRDALLGGLPSLSQLFHSLSSTDEYAMRGEVYLPRENVWHDECVAGTGQLVRLGRYERIFRFMGEVSADGMIAAAIVDARIGKWLAARSAGVPLGHFNAETSDLVVKLGCRLPGLYERVVLASSGQLPVVTRINGEIVHHYTDVPSTVGRRVLRLLQDAEL